MCVVHMWWSEDNCSQISPVVWIFGLKLTLSSLVTKHLYLLSHLAGPALLMAIISWSLKDPSDFYCAGLPPAASFRESAVHFCISVPEQPKLTPEHTCGISAPRANSRPIKPELLEVGAQILMVLAENLGLNIVIFNTLHYGDLWVLLILSW